MLNDEEIDKLNRNFLPPMYEAEIKCPHCLTIIRIAGFYANKSSYDGKKNDTIVICHKCNSKINVNVLIESN